MSNRQFSLIWAIACAPAWCCAMAAMQPPRASDPAESVVAWLIEHTGPEYDNGALEPALRKEFDDRWAMIRRDPARFTPAFQGALVLPTMAQAASADLDALRGRFWGIARAVGMTPLLGSEHAGPLLRKVFQDAQQRLEEVRKRSAGVKDRHQENARADASRLEQLDGCIRGVLNLSVYAATRLKSPVLADPVLRFHESGLLSRESTWFDYLLSLPDPKQEIETRLRVLMSNPKTDEVVRALIKQAFNAPAARRAEATPPDRSTAAAPASRR